MSNFIEQFVKNYDRQYDFWTVLCRKAEERCRVALAESLVPAIVTSRAKDPGSLKTKLLQRAAAGKNYQSVEDIEKDVFDLAGVRVALYFPSQRNRAYNLLDRHFDIKDTRQHPDPEKPDARDDVGVYTATHIRVEFRQEDETVDNRYKSSIVEIQIASLLMHVWSAVNHDLTYKELNGKLTDLELQKLREIYDQMITGETALTELKDAFDERVRRENRSFDGVHAFESFIGDSLPENLSHYSGKPLGPSSALLQALKEAGLDRPGALRPLLNAWVESLAGEEFEGKPAGAILDFLVENEVVKRPEPVD